MNSKIYQNIEPAQAQKFFQAALAAGFVSDPATVAFDYESDFWISKEILFSTLSFSVYYNPVNKTATLTITNRPVFLTEATIFSIADSYIAHAQDPNSVKPKQSVWSNVAHPYFKIRRFAPHGTETMARRPREFAQMYCPELVSKFTGKGVTVALVELGGGIDPHDMILSGYAGVDLSDGQARVIGSVLVDGASQELDGSEGAQTECTLDAQVVAGIAPNANIVAYYAPNTDQGFIDGITQAAKDIIASGKPGVISISWGGPFDQFAESTQIALNGAIGYASLNGVEVFVASGDALADDDSDHAVPDCPSCLSSAIAVGGTRKTDTAEVVWNSNGSGSGGGICDYYPPNPWQKDFTYTLVNSEPALALMRRGSPDVCANADPATGYKVVVAGQELVVGGTSGAAPLWAAITALLIEANGGKPLQKALGAGAVKGVVGLAEQLYENPAMLNDILPPGDNGVYRVEKGWDACTGLGVPSDRLLGLLKT